MRFCFTYANGVPYANGEVLLKASGKTLRTMKSEANGCGSFEGTPTDARLHVEARTVFGNDNVGEAIFAGTSPHVALPGTGTVDLGTGTVTKTCTQGVIEYCAGL